MPIWQTTVRTSSPGLGGQGVNTWHCRTENPGGTPFADADMDSLLGILRDLYADFANSGAPSGTLITCDGQFRAVGEAEGDTLVDRPGWTLDTAGTGGGPLPPVVALCVTWRTAQAGRRARGRTFFNPIRATSNQSNGTPVESLRAAMATGISDFVSANGGVGNGAWGVYSAADGVLRDITGGSVPNEFAVLRSRRD